MVGTKRATRSEASPPSPKRICRDRANLTVEEDIQNVPPCLRVLFDKSKIHSLKSFTHSLWQQYPTLAHKPLSSPVSDLLEQQIFIIYPKNLHLFGTSALPSHETAISFDQEETTAELIQRIISQILSQPKSSLASKNVLAHGYALQLSDRTRKYKVWDVVSCGIFTGTIGGGVFLSSTTAAQIECKFPNTLLVEFKQPSWTAFHQYVGDVIFSFLLYHCLICVCSSRVNNTYVQLSGVPLSEYLPSKNQPITVPLRQHPTPQVLKTRKKKAKAKIKKPEPQETPKKSVVHNWYCVHLPRFIIFYKNPRSIRHRVFASAHGCNQPITKANAYRFWHSIFKAPLQDVPVTLTSKEINGQRRKMKPEMLSLVELLHRSMKYHQKRLAYNCVLQYHCMTILLLCFMIVLLSL